MAAGALVKYFSHSARKSGGGWTVSRRQSSCGHWMVYDIVQGQDNRPTSYRSQKIGIRQKCSSRRGDLYFLGRRLNTTTNITAHFNSDFATVMTCYSWYSCVQTRRYTVQNCKYWLQQSPQCFYLQLLINYICNVLNLYHNVPMWKHQNIIVWLMLNNCVYI